MDTSKPKYRVDFVGLNENLEEFLNHKSRRYWKLVSVMARGMGRYEIVWEL